MPELIYREAALKKMCEMCYYNMGQDFICHKCNVYELLVKQPAIEAKPVRHGRWIFVGEEIMHDGWTYRKYKCSECDFLTVEAINFCQNCGADMREEGVDNAESD